MWALTVKGQSQPTVIMGKVTFGINELHTSAVSSTFSGMGGGSLPLGIGSSMNPLTGYGTFFGVCQQVTNATLLSSGVSSTVWNLAPGWSTVVSTMAYGNYGGQLSNYVYTGVSTDLNYDKNA